MHTGHVSVLGSYSLEPCTIPVWQSRKGNLLSNSGKHAILNLVPSLSDSKGRGICFQILGNTLSWTLYHLCLTLKEEEFILKFWGGRHLEPCTITVWLTIKAEEFLFFKSVKWGRTFCLSVSYHTQAKRVSAHTCLCSSSDKLTPCSLSLSLSLSVSVPLCPHTLHVHAWLLPHSMYSWARNAWYVRPQR